MASVLSVRALRKSFVLHTIDGRTVRSLHGVDLDVDAGEHVALAGPSGAIRRRCGETFRECHPRGAYGWC